MRNLLVLLFLSLLLTTGCRDDFSLEAPYQDIPVVFAYLDAQQEDHYIRVQKAFLGQNGDGELSAGVQDSLYYGPEEATVTIAQGNSQVVLERVNGNDVGINRPEGVFFSDANILYRFSNSALTFNSRCRGYACHRTAR